MTARARHDDSGEEGAQDEAAIAKSETAWAITTLSSTTANSFQHERSIESEIQVTALGAVTNHCF